MTALGQKTLISSLVDIEALDLLAREGLDPVCIPDEDLRKVVDFALNYYHDSGRRRAPTVEVLRTHYGDLLDDKEIDLGDVEETMEWALDDLRATYVHKETANFNKRLATAMAEVEIEDRVQVLSEAAAELVALSLKMESREYSVDARTAIHERLMAYEERASAPEEVRGMTFGLPQIDQYTMGIQPGQMAILAAPPKTGKSYFLIYAALAGWRRERAQCLYSLENSVEMTLDRMACMATGTDARAFRKGTLQQPDLDRIRWWMDEFAASPVPIWVLQPDEGKRTPEALVQGAQLRDADDLLIDQLSWVEHPDPGRLPRHEIVRDVLRSLRVGISTGRHRMPLLMAHQINREGAKQADKDGFLSMWNLAESAEVERAADWVFGLYQSVDERAAMAAKFQTLASRNEDNRHFMLTWRINLGVVTVRGPLELDLSRA